MRRDPLSFHLYQYLPSILATGLDRGEVPYSATNVANAVNLSTTSSPAGNAVFQGGPITQQERETIRRTTGQVMPADTRYPDKQAVRIKVKIPSADRHLVRWLPHARKRAAPDWLEALHKGQNPENWWLYFGTIPPEEFVSVDIRDGEQYIAYKK